MSARPSSGPPTLARLLLRLVLNREAAEVVTGDLDEAFAEDLSRIGRHAARRAYWRLTVRSALARWRPVAGGTRPGRAAGAPVAGIVGDVAYGARQVRRRPGFSLTVAATLAIGIAATTTVFGLANALLFKPLPYASPDRVVFLLGWDTDADQMRFNQRYIDAYDLGQRMASLSPVAIYRGWNPNLNDAGLPERVQAYRVSVNVFDVLGVRAALGRTFDAADDQGDGRIAVISHRLWASRYGSDPSIVGRTVELNGAGYTVRGVMPAAFEFPIFNFKGDLWIPLQPTPSWTPAERVGSPSIVAIGRLAPGVSLASAQSEASGIMAQLASAFPDANGSRGVRVLPMADLGREQAAPAFAVLGAAALLVLLIACTNAANLLLARGAGRSREVAVRAALGAGRWRLVRQLLIESTWLALAGGLAGAALAWLGLETVRGALPEFVVRVLPGVDLIQLDIEALAFAVAASLATVLLFGALPAWRGASPRLTEPLNSNGRGATASQSTWLRSGLVILEIGVAAALLVSTGLLARTASNLATADVGFDKDRLLAFNVSLPASTYTSWSRVEAFFDQLSLRLAEMPGITGSGSANSLPFSTSNETAEFTLQGDTELHRADYRVVSSGYLPALGARILDGRGLQSADDADDAVAVLVNDTFARQHFPDASPLGQQLWLDPTTAEDPVTVVGVVGDIRHWTLSDAIAPTVFVPISRDPRATRGVVVRTDGDPAALSALVRTAVADVDRSQAVYDVTAMSRMVENSFIAQHLASTALFVFGVTALLLTTFGLHALLAFVVGRRTQEIGVRMALGASPGSVLMLVLRRSLALTGLGLALGLMLALVVSQGLASLLFGVGPLDPGSYAGAAAILGSVALLSTWLPARRALRVDPVVALRAE